MRHIRRFAGLQRKGMALLLVMFVAFVSLALLTALFAAIAPRRTSVSQEAQANRALAVADGTIDRLLGQINNTGLTYSALPASSTDSVEGSLVSQLLVGINGGSAATASTNVRHYFYDTKTDTYYVLKNDTDPVATGTLTNLSTGVDVPGGLGLAGLDATYASDNRWFQLDTNATYWYDANKPDTWNIRATAFNMSEPDIKRTIQAEVNRGDITISPADVANGAWFTASSSTKNYFSDYSITYHNTVKFGNLMDTSGGLRSDADVYMGGWAEGPVYASGTVYDYYTAGDHHGRFGIDHVNLATATSQGLVTNNVPQANWLTNGTAALTTLSSNSASSAYNVTGTATIVFSVVGGVGKVQINNGALLNLPVNGAIYVNGNATVSGTVRGKVTIGANADIYVGGNIIYTNPPRADMNAQPVDVSLQDELGLIARSDIIIPVSTYNANQTLTIDAAMLAVTGNFGLDASHFSSYSSHSVNSSPHWVLTDNGSHSAYLSDSAPCIGSDPVQGYEVQHIKYDWNLTNGARPPAFPAADDSVPSHPVYGVYNGADLAMLQALTISQLTAVTALSNPSAYAVGVRYSYLAPSGTTYYYGNEFNWVYTGGYAASKNSLYRVSWKEEIAQPVGGN
jgi:hypothetical protein